MLKNLKELVSIDSYENKDQIIEYLKNRFTPICDEVKIIKNKENNDKSLIIGVNTKLKDVKPIVLSGHIDTVAPDFEKYKTNPFELTEIDGKAYGLGSIDMKSFVAVILDNINRLKQFEIPIIIALTTDEETSLICVKNVINCFKTLNIRPLFTVVGEPTKCQINNQSNGCYEFEIEVTGKSCHSSVLNQGINAINIMAKIISFIEKKQKVYRFLTSNCGVIGGGDVVNRVPGSCSLLIDIRSTNIGDVDKFLNIIMKKIEKLKIEYKTKIEIKKLLEIPPLEIKNKKLIKDLADRLDLNVDKFVGGCEAGYYQKLSGDAMVFGVGDMSLAHKPNEYVEINQYKIYSELLFKLIIEIEKNIK